ncbi:hypothetical protein TI04_03255 [Achromatium sp. WMS2]|nr:hypothetical protein TI04_03255 [Achromatium sp. WMS2]
MIQTLSKERAQSLFYVGGILLLFLFLALGFQTALDLSSQKSLYDSSVDHELSANVILGKTLWDKNNCSGCHTLLGEGSYFGSELDTVFSRYQGHREAIKDSIRFIDTYGIRERRVMPRFKFTESELDAIVDFLRYASEINIKHWPTPIKG